MTEVKTVEEVNDIFIKNVENDYSYNSYLVSCLDDKKQWNEMVKEGFDVYNVELILSGVMKQELEWNLHHLWSEITSDQGKLWNCTRTI